MNTVRNVMLAATLITAGTVQANEEITTQPTESKNVQSQNKSDCYGPYFNHAYPFTPASDQQHIQEWMTAQREAMEAHQKAQFEAMQAQQKAMNDYLQRLNELYRPVEKNPTDTDSVYGLYPTVGLSDTLINARWKAFEDRRKARMKAMRIRQDQYAERMQQLHDEFDAKRETFAQRHNYYFNDSLFAANENVISEN